MATHPIPPIAPLQPTALPPGRFTPQDHDWYKAYEECRRIEQKYLILKHQATVPAVQRERGVDVIHARVLGYLLSYAISDEGRTYVAEEIARCDGREDDILLVGKKWKDHLLQAFRQHRPVTPIPTEHPSRPSFEEELFLFAAAIDRPPVNHATSKALALKRDGHRCLATGAFDGNYLDALVANGQPLPPLSLPAVPTNAAHIFPPYINEGLTPENSADKKTQWSSCVWAQILNFAQINALDDLNGSQIHRLGNTLTLATAMHGLFDRLVVWFDEDQYNPNPASHTYIVNASRAYYLIGVNRRVSFGNADLNTSHEPPDRRFLKLHAAVCRVAHLSGAAEYMDKLDRDHEETFVLAADGTSADLLSLRLNHALRFAGVYE